MDDILLYSLVASSKSPADYVIGSEGLQRRAVRRDDAARTIAEFAQGRRHGDRQSLQERRRSTRSTTSGS